MGTWTNAFERELIDKIVSGGTLDASYIGLLTAVVNEETGTVTELIGDGYARKLASDCLGAAATAGGGTSSAHNPAIVRWDTLDSVDDKTIYGVGIWDDDTGGNLRGVDTLETPITISAGEPAEIPVGGGVVSQD